MLSKDKLLNEAQLLYGFCLEMGTNEGLFIEIFYNFEHNQLVAAGLYYHETQHYNIFNNGPILIERDYKIYGTVDVADNYVNVLDIYGDDKNILLARVFQSVNDGKWTLIKIDPQNAEPLVCDENGRLRYICPMCHGNGSNWFWDLSREERRRLDTANDRERGETYIYDSHITGETGCLYCGGTGMWLQEWYVDENPNILSWPAWNDIRQDLPFTKGSGYIYMKPMPETAVLNSAEAIISALGYQYKFFNKKILFSFFTDPEYILAKSEYLVKQFFAKLSENLLTAFIREYKISKDIILRLYHGLDKTKEKNEFVEEYFHYIRDFRNVPEMEKFIDSICM